MMKNNEQGFTQIITIGLLLAGVVAASGVSYYVLKSQGQAPKINTIPTTYVSEFVQPSASPTPISPQSIGISDSTDINTIQMELNSTTLNSTDADLNSLNASAGSI